MAIQILGLRDNPRMPARKRTVFFKNNWRADSVNEIFEKISHIIEKIPQAERYNMYFTVADCFEEDGRKLKEQHVIPFDIDKLAGSTTEDVRHQAEVAARTACATLGVAYARTGVIFSGNGVQLFVQIPKPILADDYFDTMRAHYKVVCDKIQSALTQHGVSGEIDTSVFSAGRLMRLPLTENRKPNKPTRVAEILQGQMEPQDFYLDQLSGISEIEKPDQIKMDVIKRYPEPDSDEVLKGCHFIKHCFDNPKDVSEPQWYAAASVVVRLYKDQEKSKELFHKMSEGHPSYNYYETELKANQALENAGPRTCKNIETLWDGCKNCPHYGTNLISPILIHGEKYIASKDFGFREITHDKQGNIKPGKPVYDDLEKQFASEYEFTNLINSRTMYVMDKTHWRRFDDTEIMSWAKLRIDPSPSANEMNEFKCRITLLNQKPDDWVNASTHGHMNFLNGVLDIHSGELKAHNAAFGFMHVIPYAYDPRAECPRWDKFMLEVTEEDQELVDVLHEFAGYAISGMPCIAHKALLLCGEGANGKSLFADTLAEIVGGNNFSSVFLQDLKNDQMRAQLRHKLFNISDEGSGSLKDSNEFKALVSGGTVTAKEVYRPTFNFRNTAKLIVLTNNLPYSTDTSAGFFRRFLIIKFNRTFMGTDDNKNLRFELWEELPGICNRFIQGLRRLTARKFMFTESLKIDHALEEYMEDVNNLKSFVEDELIICDGAEISQIEVYTRYKAWADLRGERPISYIGFCKNLRRTRALPDKAFFRSNHGSAKVRGIYGYILNKEY